jgi:hypothetical protein
MGIIVKTWVVCDLPNCKRKVIVPPGERDDPELYAMKQRWAYSDKGKLICPYCNAPPEKIPLRSLAMPPVLSSYLKNRGYKTMADIVYLTYEEMVDLPRIGKKIEYLVELIERQGYEIRRSKKSASNSTTV